MTAVARTVLLGLSLDSGSFEPVRHARLGHMRCGPAGFLRDLELRLGLVQHEEQPASRLPQWTARMRRLANESAFYAASFAADELGTATAILTWRDSLVEAGWNCGPIPNGGARLDALAALANDLAFPLNPLVPGRADRVRSAHHALTTQGTRCYDALSLVEPLEAWSTGWQRVFSALESLGTSVTQQRLELPGASATSDLGKLQHLVRERSPIDRSNLPEVRGDGSLHIVRGETPTEVAELSAALVRRSDEQTLVVRCADPQPLERALRRFGCPGQGVVGASTWRPALQLLPLVLELAFEPKDPYRVLELLTLPVGPFRGALGALLAKAIARQPGVGGQEWTKRKADAEQILRSSFVRRAIAEGKSEEVATQDAEAYVAERMARVAQWLEAPGVDGDGQGISREQLLVIVSRTQTWIQGQLAIEDRRPSFAPAFAQGRRFVEALVSHDVDVLSREAVRQLFDSVARSAARQSLSTEEAGRLAHVAHPSGILGSASTVLVWSCIAGIELRPKPRPWSPSETAALRTAGVSFLDAKTELACESESWRRLVLAARERLVFVVPGTQGGAAVSPHPVWDEIATRLGLESNPKAYARILLDVRTLVRDAEHGAAPVELLSPLALPTAADAWQMPYAIDADEQKGKSATALQTLAGCPLAWVLEHRAELRFGSVAKVAEGPLLNGNLSHRLVEVLFVDGAFDLSEAEFVKQVAVTVDALIKKEAATLLLPGAVFERDQLVRQVRFAMRELYRYLSSSGYRIAAVEEPVAFHSTVGSPHGRLDVRLVDAEGNDAILDLKWGRSTYERYLKTGAAIQLALYSRAVGQRQSPPTSPPAAYYALGKAKVLTTDARMRPEKVISGLSLEDTWSRFQRTRDAVVSRLSLGEVLVAQPTAPALVERLGIPPDRHDLYYQAERGEEGPCKFCAFGPVCGNAWEGFR